LAADPTLPNSSPITAPRNMNIRRLSAAAATIDKFPLAKASAPI
jgi:hypothetical protein